MAKERRNDEENQNDGAVASQKEIDGTSLVGRENADEDFAAVQGVNRNEIEDGETDGDNDYSNSERNEDVRISGKLTKW